MKVKELLTDESKWTRHANARDAVKDKVPPTDPEAKCWCLLGAIDFCYQGKLIADKVAAIEKLNEVVHEYYKTASIVHFNDRKATFEDIKKVIELADI